ncbi:MAG: helicase-associated domain-containing protein, partial [Planctomycetota bacterium]
YHLRIEKERVERAVVRGLGADELIAVLREHAETPVPQNVEYSIRSWAERVRVATAEQVFVFELADAHTLDVVAELPEMKGLVVRRISPTALALREAPSDRSLIEALRTLGVYVR